MWRHAIAEARVKNWQIESDDGKAIIAVPACDATWANVAVFYKDSYRRYQYGGQVQHTVNLPSMTFELMKCHVLKDMSDEVYQSYLESNKKELLALIARLNNVS